jgi:DNA-binding MarR family transcriptional regulator
MIRYPSHDVKLVSKFDYFLYRALTDITGEEIQISNLSDNKDMISFLAQKIARDTGLDSSDIAKWISSSLKRYWIEVEFSG